MRRLTFTLAAAAASLVMMAPAAGAQSQADRDANEVMAYRLTMAAARKYEAVTEALFATMKADPRTQAIVKLQGEIDALRDKDELSDAEAARLEKLERQLEEMENSDDGEDASDSMEIDKLVAEIEKIPGVKAALRSGGMTGREYIVFGLALVQAQMIAGMIQGGMIKEAQIPEKANKANVKFVLDNGAYFKALAEKAERWNKAAPQ